MVATASAPKLTQTQMVLQALLDSADGTLEDDALIAQCDAPEPSLRSVFSNLRRDGIIRSEFVDANTEVHRLLNHEWAQQKVLTSNLPPPARPRNDAERSPRATSLREPFGSTVAGRVADPTIGERTNSALKFTADDDAKLDAPISFDARGHRVVAAKEGAAPRSECSPDSEQALQVPIAPAAGSPITQPIVTTDAPAPEPESIKPNCTEKPYGSFDTPAVAPPVVAAPLQRFAKAAELVGQWADVLHDCEVDEPPDADDLRRVAEADATKEWLDSFNAWRTNGMLAPASGRLLYGITERGELSIELGSGSGQRAIISRDDVIRLMQFLTLVKPVIEVAAHA